MIIANERLRKNYNIAMQVVEDIIGEQRIKEKGRKILSVGISPRATKRHGICKYEYDGCRIEVSKHLFMVEDKEMITTLIHEILHTFKDTNGHDTIWKWYAKKINDNSDYNITRTRNIKGIEKQYKYKIKCLNCDSICYRNKIANRIIDCFKSKSARCKKCKHRDFEIIDIKNNIKVV